MEKLQRTAQELADSIAGLTSELNELKQRKKSWNADINARIKDREELISSENEQWKKLKERDPS